MTFEVPASCVLSFSFLDDLVDQAVFLCLIARHEKVAIRVGGYSFDGLPRMFGDDPVQLLLDPEYLPGVDVDIGRLSLKTPHTWWTRMRACGRE